MWSAKAKKICVYIHVFLYIHIHTCAQMYLYICMQRKEDIWKEYVVFLRWLSATGLSQKPLPRIW